MSPDPTPPPAEPAPSLRPVDDLHRLVEEIVMAPGWREALRAAVAAADRENAELRGQLRESDSRFRTAAELLGERTSQLAAAQAQLAEVASLLIARSDSAGLIEGLEKVRQRLCHYGPDASTCDCKYGASFRGEQSGCPELRRAIAALSAAPQPEPARCADKCPSLVGGPAFCCVLTAGHIGWHEAETEGNGYPPMHWLTPDDADGPR